MFSLSWAVHGSRYGRMISPTSLMSSLSARRRRPGRGFFLTEWEAGRYQTRYEQTERTDMATVPAPRLDLLRMKDYAFGSVQFSRGCPFECEFCDIIVTFGRRPRIKSSAQILAELDAIVAAGKHSAFIVDDNLIGNKRAIKLLLRDVVAWQERRGYPLMFATEASIDLAEDGELMQLMVDANIANVFIGIETPNEESLRETKKLQNLRTRGGTMLEKVHRIQKTGMEVWCGIIVGFDNDDTSVFAAQRRFVHEARIVHAMVNMLVAIPRTPLYTRLASEDRLDLSDDAASWGSLGTNVIPRRISREALRREYRRRLMRVAWRRREPEVVQGYAIKCAMHFHAHRMVQEMLSQPPLS